MLGFALWVAAGKCLLRHASHIGVLATTVETLPANRAAASIVMWYPPPSTAEHRFLQVKFSMAIKTRGCSCGILGRHYRITILRSSAE
jgi:hypothetical protein